MTIAAPQEKSLRVAVVTLSRRLQVTASGRGIAVVVTDTFGAALRPLFRHAASLLYDRMVFVPIDGYSKTAAAGVTPVSGTVQTAVRHGLVSL